MKASILAAFTLATALTNSAWAAPSHFQSVLLDLLPPGSHQGVTSDENRNCAVVITKDSEDQITVTLKDHEERVRNTMNIGSDTRNQSLIQSEVHVALKVSDSQGVILQVVAQQDYPVVVTFKTRTAGVQKLQAFSCSLE